MNNNFSIKVLIILISILSNDLSSQNQLLQFKIMLNGIEEKVKYDVLVIDYNRDSIDSILGVNNNFIIFLEYKNIYELRFRHSDKYSINKVLIDVNNISVGAISISINLISVNRFSIKEINEGFLYFNSKINSWRLYNSSDSFN